MAKNKRSDEIEIAVLSEKIINIDKNVTEIKKKMEDDYVTKSEFEPIKRIVYGVVTLMLGAIITALIATVIIK